MKPYVLDTDHLTLSLHAHPAVVARARAVGDEDLAITVITAEEQLTGWYTQVRKARDPDKLARAYQGLYEVVETLKRATILPFTRAAVDRFMELKKALPRLGSHDLMIAAIVLDVKGTLVTRNRSDFDPVPGLRIEDWSKP